MQHKSTTLISQRAITAKYAKYAVWGAYLSTLHIIEWGIPEKILQNAVQTHFRSIGPPCQKLRPNLIFCLISPL